MKKFNKWMKDPEFKENYEKFKNEDKSFLKNLKNPNAEKNYETNMRKKMVENAELDKNLKDKGITKPSNWNEMGASEKDLWYDSAKKQPKRLIQIEQIHLQKLNNRGKQLNLII